MCNIHFDEQAVTRAINERARRCNQSTYDVDPVQVYRDLYPDTPIGGIKLHFIEKVKGWLVEEAFRAAFIARAEGDRLGLHQVSIKRVVEDVLGVRLSPDDHALAFQRAQAVWYDMIIEEAQALREA